MTYSTKTRALLLSGFIGTVLLAACGGGGSNSSAPVSNNPTPPPVSSGPTWTQGVFASEGQFKNRCASPRSGTNPATGNPFPDVAGSTLFENHWLRSWSNNTYLWYNEITDQNPANFSNRLTYFETLKTTRTTASGTPVDQFHFTQNTAEYQQRVSSGSSAGYGLDLALLRTSPPRDIRIAYTDPNTPASAANIARGAIILEVDGVDAVNGGSQSDVDKLNAALFPNSAGESHTFVIQDLGAAQTRSVTLTSQVVTSSPVNRTEVINTPSGNVGYILFNTFGTSIAEEQIVDAMTAMNNSNVNDLVIDLRYNGGGFLAISAQLGYMVAGNARTNGRTFDALTFNNKHTVTNPVTGNPIRPTPFIDQGVGFTVPEGQSLPSLNLNRVFILSTSGTCSASEALINGLRGVDVEVILIGTRTCGKPYGFYATDNCGETYFTVQFRGENDKGFGDYSDGFNPANASDTLGERVVGCAVPDDFGNALGDENEALLSAALQYRETGVCPVTNATQKAVISYSDPSVIAPGDLMSDLRIQNRIRLDNIRIENRPAPSKGKRR